MKLWHKGHAVDDCKVLTFRKDICIELNDWCLDRVDAKMNEISHTAFLLCWKHWNPCNSNWIQIHWGTGHVHSEATVFSLAGFIRRFSTLMRMVGNFAPINAIVHLQRSAWAPWGKKYMPLISPTPHPLQPTFYMGWSPATVVQNRSYEMKLFNSFVGKSVCSTLPSLVSGLVHWVSPLQPNSDSAIASWSSNGSASAVDSEMPHPWSTTWGQTAERVNHPKAEQVRNFRLFRRMSR